MAIKKSQLYSSIWKSCDELRGGMDASQYKDYVLVLLFIKYISDRYAGVTYAPIKIPEGSSFKDMVALKGKVTIGDDINKKIIQKIEEENPSLGKLAVDFNDPAKLGSGKDMVDRLTKLIAIFENPALDFSKNRAEGDDILGDAYEYLMKNFATQSGKSKGQFYTPAEVSRIIARTIGIANTKNDTPTVYDPTCGSGSLLLKVADETDKNVKLYGQEMDNATAALARMNMILHNNPTSIIERENTLSTPLFKDGSQLKTFDFVVANPPFSYKSWSNGVDPVHDVFGRFQDFGTPPAKNGDYAFFLHIIRSLKTTGKGACILPHGVLFRGNAEAAIRTNIIRRGYIKGIIGLPANLFYGTGIPACIIVLDKENADNRKGIFMINASKGFVKDGNKNRLRAQDIHKIVDVFNKQLEIPKYSRMVSVVEIEKNEFNLNIPRYIDSQEAEDIQDIEAHLKGDIPTQDIEDLHNYWSVYQTLKTSLFSESKRKGYSTLKIAQEEIKHTIFSHPEFTKYAQTIEETFAIWKERNTVLLKKLTTNVKPNVKPKEIIHEMSEDILATFSKTHLIDKYDIYEHLMEYWAETMQDDMYLVSAGGWLGGAHVREIIPTKDKNRKTVWGEEHDYLRGKRRFKSDLITSVLLISRYYASEQAVIDTLEEKMVGMEQEFNDIIEENSGEGGLLDEVIEGEGDKRKIAEKTVKAQMKKIGNLSDCAEEYSILEKCMTLFSRQTEMKKSLKAFKKDLEDKIVMKYPALAESEIKVLVVDDKWMATLEQAVKGEMDRISQRLTGRIKELAERYATPLPILLNETETLSRKVDEHLKKMGFNIK